MAGRKSDSRRDDAGDGLVVKVAALITTPPGLSGSGGSEFSRRATIMQTRAAAIAEVKSYVADKIRSDVDAQILAEDIVDADTDMGRGGHGEVRGYYTLTGNPLTVSFEPVADEAAN
jgi:hypothetical protein